MRIQASFQQNKIHYKNYLLLLVICLLAYWPLTFGIFSVKNDAIHYFLPYRFNISEAIRHGAWPFWSPYIYLGNPIYGDMQSGAWNQIVWLFSLFGRYDLTLFHYENLLYIFLGAVGMYKLTNRLVQHSHTALLIAVSYMFSGFMLGGQLINWLAAAAFFPFVIHYYLQTLRSNSLSSALKTGIALFFLFTAGYPSFFIITFYVLLLLFIIEIIGRIKDKEISSVSWGRFFLQHLLVILIFTALSLPAIISFAELLPYYQRGGGTSYIDTIQNSFGLQHLLSLLFPSSIKANDIVSATDITCRNVYIGIFALLVLVIFPPKFNKRNILLISLAAFALLFSLGDATPVRKLCYDIVPLMNSFRHPSQMRLFFLFALLLLAAPGLKKLLDKNLSSSELKKIKITAWITGAAILLITLLGFIYSDFLTQLSGINFSEARNAIKNMFENISLADAVAVNGLIQLLFIAELLLWARKHSSNKKYFSSLWIANLFIMAQLVLPISFVSKTSPHEINKIIHSSAKDFPTAGLEKSIGENSKDALDQFDKIALTYFYNKKIGISHISNSPSFLEEQDRFLKSTFLYNYISSKPLVYIADSVLQLQDTSTITTATHCNYAFLDTVSQIKNNCSPGDTSFIKKILPNRLEIETQTVTASFLVLTQSYHHYWKAWIDNEPAHIYKTNISFMGISLLPGKHTVIFRFIPSNTLKAIWIMLAAMVALILIGIISLIHQKSLSRQE